MWRLFLIGATLFFLLTSCTSTLKVAQNSNYNNYSSNAMPNLKSAHGPNAGSAALKQVTITSGSTKSDTRLNKLMTLVVPQHHIDAYDIEKVEVENKLSAPNDLQVKYGLLLNILPQMLLNVKLLEQIDDWFGTRYLYGGTTKRGIDCSAFTKTMFREVYGIELPRTAREQYVAARRISSTELKEGDLLFFNTTGGVSHVGIYLRNNKFVHSSSGKGVTISDLYDSYYISHYIGAGRMEAHQAFALNN